MDANLVPAPGHERAPEQRQRTVCRIAAREALEPRDAPCAVRRYDDAPAIGRIDAERQIDLAAFDVHVAFDDREVFLSGIRRRHCALQGGMCARAPGEDDGARGQLVEAADDTKGVRRTPRRCPSRRLADQLEQRAGRILVRRMDDDAGRFVGDEEMGIFVEDGNHEGGGSDGPA